MRLGFWQQTAVYTTLAIVGLSGLLWFALHDLVEEEPSELQRTLLVLHGVSAFASLIVFGSLFPLHMRSAWLRRRNIATGASVTIVMAILIVTALLLYYGGEETRAAARWIHIGVGLLCFAVFPIHVIFGRRLRQPQYLYSVDQCLKSEPTMVLGASPLERWLPRTLSVRIGRGRSQQRSQSCPDT